MKNRTYFFFKNGGGLKFVGAYFPQNRVYNLYFSNNYLTFNSFYNLVFYSLKNGLIPIMLFYQERKLEDKSYNNNNNDVKDMLTKEQINFLEKYCINIDDKIEKRRPIKSSNFIPTNINK